VHFVLNTGNSKTHGCATRASWLVASSQNNRASIFSVFKKKYLKTEIGKTFEIFSTCNAKGVSNIKLSKCWNFQCSSQVQCAPRFLTGNTNVAGLLTYYLQFCLSVGRMWNGWLANYRTYWENSLFRYRNSTTLTTCGLWTETFLCITKSLAKWIVFNIMQIQKVNNVKID